MTKCQSSKKNNDILRVCAVVKAAVADKRVIGPKLVRDSKSEKQMLKTTQVFLVFQVVAVKNCKH